MALTLPSELAASTGALMAYSAFVLVSSITPGPNNTMLRRAYEKLVIEKIDLTEDGKVVGLF